MARIIRTDLSTPDQFDEMGREWIYNGLDCCVTSEVLDGMQPQLTNITSATYNFSRELQGPVLEMGLRGVLVDQWRKQEVIDTIVDNMEMLEAHVERLALEGVGMMSFKWGSPADRATLFYDKLGLPVVKKGGRPTTDRNALEKLDGYLVARPFTRHLMALGELRKRLGFLKTGIDPDGRMRTSYNIAGTNTGRFSSSYSEFGTGTNLQNVEEYLRSIFIADPGMKFAKFDAKSGESFVVGAIEWNLFDDPRYLEVCESGDPHTAVARICWPKLDWTGNLSRDKELAESPYYRHYTYRFMCKKLGHGSNYGGKPNTLAQQSRLPITVVETFQPLYFRAFPAHLSWHEYVDREIRTAGKLITLLGRQRRFWGRRDEAETLRGAIAYDPQSSLADIVNRAMLRIWRERIAILMFQDHDALTFMYPEDQEDVIVPKLWAMLPEKIELKNGRFLEIPYDCKVGWNKGDYNPKTNIDGLKDYKGPDTRKRTVRKHILDR